MRHLLHRRAGRAALSIPFAAAVWLATLHLWFFAPPDAIAESLAARQLALWEEDTRGERTQIDLLGERLRASNPEWDLMARLFDVLAFANLAVSSPERARYLAAIDRIITATLDDEASRGQHHFLLSYSRRAPFLDVGGRSLFVDGEIALMLAARQLVAADPRWAEPLRDRIDRIAAQLERGPVLVGESYPDEVWMFCNAVALVAIRLHDRVTGADHAGLLARWTASARAHLVDPATGLLVSSATLNGEPRDGPEGSTIWLVAHMLLVVDPELARDQYARARPLLGRGLLGFAWAREWPDSWPGPDDVDSGPTIPVLEVNAGSSGLAIVAARSFGDEEFLAGLVTSLELGGFPLEDSRGLRYAAGNQLADAVLLYGLVAGPLWERAGVSMRRAGGAG